MQTPAPPAVAAVTNPAAAVPPEVGEDLANGEEDDKEEQGQDNSRCPAGVIGERENSCLSDFYLYPEALTRLNEVELTKTLLNSSRCDSYQFEDFLYGNRTTPMWDHRQ